MSEEIKSVVPVRKRNFNWSITFVIIHTLIAILDIVGNIWRIQAIDLIYGCASAALMTIYISLATIPVWLFLQIKVIKNAKIPFSMILYGGYGILWAVVLFLCAKFFIQWKEWYSPSIRVPLITNTLFSIAAISISVLAFINEHKKSKGAIIMEKETMEISESKNDKEIVTENSENRTEAIPAKTEQEPATTRVKAGSGLFVFLALACFATAIFLGYKAYNVKNVYSYKNQYVGGDAYNYIINAGYFAGYVASCLAAVVGGIVSSATAGIINAINKSRG